MQATKSASPASHGQQGHRDYKLIGGVAGIALAISAVAIFGIVALVSDSGEPPAEPVRKIPHILPVAKVEVMPATPPAAAAPAAESQPAPATAAAPAAPIAAATPAAPANPPAAAGDATAEAKTLVERWAKAWSERDVAQYLSLYGKDFKPDQGLSRSAWEQNRKQRIESKRSITVTVKDLRVEPAGDKRLVARFLQDYTADSFSESGTPKELLLAREDAGWRIVGEGKATK